MAETDLELIGRYRRERAEDAFAEVVRRHLGLVYSAALRQVRSPQLAEEVSQSVFSDLARQADRLAPGTILTAWLYQVTRRTAIDVVRRESRRQLREHIATELNAMNATADDWTHVEPLLDEAMEALDSTDRAAVLLRYFENKSLREVGATLGTSDDAAQKRVSRAVERLRDFFVKRGLKVGASGLVVALSANAVQAAPAGLVISISTAAALAGTGVVATTAAIPALTSTATKIITMTTIQKTIVGATLAAAVGTGIYEARQVSQLREQNQALQLQHAQQLQQLQGERDAANSRLAAIADEIAKLKSNSTELLKLRGEVGGLRQQTAAADRLQQENRALREAQVNAAKSQPEDAPVHFAKESWRFAGYATPEATMQSAVWAQTRNDLNTFLASLAPEAQSEVKSAMARQPDSAPSMMAAVNKVKGFTILKKVTLAEDQVLLRVRNEMEDGSEKLMTSTLKRINGEWRVQSGRSD